MTPLPLTNRQQDVAECIGRGLSYRDAALELGVAVGTVRKHVEQIADKLPNPDSLPQKTIVFLFAAHEQWKKAG